MIEILRLGGGLLLLVVANIALGSIKAAMNREWDTRTFVNGLIKGAIVIGAFAAVYGAGWLNPDLAVVEIDGQQVTLSMGVFMILVVGFTYYAGKVLLKLKDIITAKVSSSEEKTPEQKEEENKTQAALETLIDLIGEQNTRAEKTDQILQKLYDGIFGKDGEPSIDSDSGSNEDTPETPQTE